MSTEHTTVQVTLTDDEVKVLGGEDPETKKESYKEMVESGDDAVNRKRVAAALTMDPMTIEEATAQFDDIVRNNVRPRLYELVKMGCAVREGKRENVSGHDAYVHHITEKGRRYLRGEINPDVPDSLAEVKGEIVETLRRHRNGEATWDAVEQLLLKHDEMKGCLEPDFNPDWGMEQ